MAGVREIAGGGHGGANGKGQPMAKEKKWSFHVCTNASPPSTWPKHQQPWGGGSREGEATEWKDKGGEVCHEYVGYVEG